ncbi:MAG TPA: MFS transporter [Stellaceae bacterium]|jgi:AAHS family 4-hydroxybenzoate transporter-like MFS transporter|nr:MFS transporter [Stellaceae bacterium]
MAQAKTIDVAELVESRKIGRVQIGIWALAFLMVFADGFDFSGPLAGAPAILRAFQAPKTELGWVFSLGNFGALLGAYLFGYVNDRFGRRNAALLAVLCYTLPALGSGFATSLGQLGMYRFVVGLGVGGIMPTAIAYLVEIAPKRFRVTMVMCGVLGFTTGIAAVGQVAAWLIPIWGWQVVFFLPACVGLALCILLYFVLPESLRYLTLHKPDSAELRRRVASIAPELELGPQTRFTMPVQPQAKGISPKPLFQGNQRIVTPLLWSGYFFEALTFMALTNWFAVLMETLKLTPLQASLTYSYGALLGIACVVLVAWCFDKLGPVAVAGAILISSAGIVALGIPGLTPTLIIVFGILSFSFAQSAQGSFNGMVGVFYPTHIRGQGIGYAGAMGRLAQIIGPLVTGYLLSAALPLQTTLYIVATPFIIAAGICIALDVVYKRRFAGGEASARAAMPAQPVAVAASAGE